MSTTVAVLECTLTCPQCGHQATETMTTDACIFFYDCANCGALLRPKRGDCCVFCSYGKRGLSSDSTRAAVLQFPGLTIDAKIAGRVEQFGTALRVA